MLAEREFLTDEDVAAVTGRKNACQQCTVLDKMGIPYLLSARGKPQVSRHHTRMIAQGIEVRQSVGVDLSKVR